jgi:hypothetical protein
MTERRRKVLEIAATSKKQRKQAKTHKKREGGLWMVGFGKLVNHKATNRRQGLQPCNLADRWGMA